MVIDPELAFTILSGIMVFITAALFLWFVLGGSVEAGGQLEARLERLGIQRIGKDDDGLDEDARARKALQSALAELDTIRQREGRSYLTRLLRSSGVERTYVRHIAISLIVMLAAFLGSTIFGLPFPLAMVLASGAGVGVPILYLQYLAKRRMKTFSNDLPGALELIVRGIRAGLPLTACLKIVSEEWHDPLRREFAQVSNDLGMGLNVREAISRFADRVPVQEARLFAIVIAIQSQSGGNLSEVLTNLAELLREKGKLETKILALTSESRTSAWIIGSIPFFIMGGVSVISPDFLQPLFQTGTGNIILGLCAAWMSLGFLVMRSMMKVDL